MSDNSNFKLKWKTDGIVNHLEFMRLPSNYTGGNIEVIYRKTFHSLEASSSYYQIPTIPYPERATNPAKQHNSHPPPLLLIRSYTISLLEYWYLLATCLNVPFFFFREV